MDNLERAKRGFQGEVYKKLRYQGIDVDEMSEATAKAALKRVLGIAAGSGSMQYIVAVKEVLGHYDLANG